MKMRLAFFPLLACLALSAPAYGDDDDDGFKCNPDGNQQELNTCAYDDWEKADEELNAVYKDAVAFAKKEDAFFDDNPSMKGALEALKKGQRAWIDYRDGTCDLEGFNARGGSMEPLLIFSCQAELTRKRTRELKEIMAWPEELPADEESK
ncbi:lysozyme inhibitor LprI family protein [Rhizobium sp. L1K21]|nr:lysozyme inhibitor LprI family protein [Rhizobium sp. L1K21]MCO6185319.1 lysozyme inhibitor LprI family protein [Rhizobium sp. L1K21]